MKRRYLMILLLAAASMHGAVHAQSQKPLALTAQQQAEKDKRMEWWRDARFGMFIHWGLYAVPGRHEWVQSREQIPAAKYQVYFDHFSPDLYDPAAWARSAKKAGMKYMVITTKHHEGFCLWDSEYTDFKATNTPAGKDLLKPLVDAFRAEGIRIGFYYSLIDWHHPHFPIDKLHPLRENKEALAANGTRDIKQYQQYLKNQLKELLTRFGTIDELFLDYSYPGEKGKGHSDWDAENLLKMVRQLQPGIIINDRADLNNQPWAWDYKTPEQFMPRTWPEVDGVKIPWETCQTFSGSWGYFRDEYSWKSAPQLITMLAETVSKGGNLLLNVGPTARGVFDKRATERLDAIGEWMHFNSRAIYGCTQAPDSLARPDNCLLTFNPLTRRLYIHVLDWPFKTLHLPGYKGKIAYAQLLQDGSEIKIRETPISNSHGSESNATNDLMLDLPVQRPETILPVIEVFLR